MALHDPFEKLTVDIFEDYEKRSRYREREAQSYWKGYLNEARGFPMSVREVGALEALAVRIGKCNSIGPDFDFYQDLFGYVKNFGSTRNRTVIVPEGNQDRILREGSLDGNVQKSSLASIFRDFCISSVQAQSFQAEFTRDVIEVAQRMKSVAAIFSASYERPNEVDRENAGGGQ